MLRAWGVFRFTGGLMKSGIAASLLMLSAIGGCSSEGRIETAGDHPTLGKQEPMTPEAREAELDTGRLLVYAPRITDARGDAEIAPRGPHSGYTIYTEAGLELAHETNQAGARAEGPVEHRLAPGRYFVRLDESVEGPREFWVTVERAKVTRVESKKGDKTPPTVR